jgi:hypothetical protein
LSKIRHITFGTPNYTRPVRQLRETAARFGIKTFAYTIHHPQVVEIARRCPEILRQPRGGGYWLWKPAVILDALESCDDGTILMYTDAAMHMIGDPAPMLCHAQEFPIMLFEHTFPLPDGPVQYPMGQWTKRDAFVLLGADIPDCHRQQQLWGGLQIYRNGRTARAFVREVLEAACDERVLTDLPNTQRRDNLPGFRDHRHDQSVLSIIAWRHGLPHFPDPTQYGHDGPRPALDKSIDGVERPVARFARIFDLHRRPDRGVLTKLRSRLNPIRTGGWSDCEVDLPLGVA